MFWACRKSHTCVLNMTGHNAVTCSDAHGKRSSSGLKLSQCEPAENLLRSNTPAVMVQVMDIVDEDHHNGVKGVPGGRSNPQTPAKEPKYADTASAKRPSTALGPQVAEPGSSAVQQVNGGPAGTVQSEGRPAGDESAGADRHSFSRSDHSTAAPQTGPDAPKKDEVYSKDLNTVL